MRRIWSWLRRLPPKRVAIGALVAGGIAAAAYLAYRLHGMGIETPVRLPFARWGEVLDLKNPHLVHLTTRGEVFLGADRVSLQELSDRTSADRRPVIVCADADARVLWLWYLLHVCPQAYIAVDDGWRTALMPTVFWERAWAVGSYADVVARPGAPGPEVPDSRDVSFVLASDYFPDKFMGSADAAVKILREVMEAEAKQAEEYRDYWGIEYPSEDFSPESGSSPACEPRASVADYILALDVYHRIEAHNIRVMRVWPTPWTMRQASLPRNLRSYRQALAVRSSRSIYWSHQHPLELAVAHIPAFSDPDAGDSLSDWEHLTIEVSPTGELWWKGPVGSLGEIGRICIAQADQWTRKRKRRGKESREGPGGRFSTLPFRVRAGRNLDWGSLRWLLHVAYRSGFHRQRLWVRSGADLSWTRADRKVLGYGSAYTEMYIEEPPPVGFNESLFPLPLAWDTGQQEDWISVTIHEPRRDSGVRYSVADHPRTDDVAVRNDLLTQHAETRQVRLRIEPRVPLWRVVEMIDYLRRHDHDVFLKPYTAEIPPEVLAGKRLPGSR